MFSDHIKNRADSQSCQYLPAKRLNVILPDLLANLIDSVPNINELPKHGTLKRHHRRNSMAATSTRSLNTIDRFNTDDDLDNPASPRDESLF